jgi:hypothetical protein
MNFIKLLNGFLLKADNDSRLTPQHITIYLSLFRQWNRAFFQNPISITRSQIMAMAHVGSNHTYAKCMNDLHKWGYLRYEPSFNPQKQSIVHLCIFDTGSDIGSVSNMHPLYTNNTNYSNLGEQAQNFESQNFNSAVMETLEKKEKSCAKKEINPNHPPLEHVIIYFVEKNFSELEAEKFFNHFESNGWLVGGRSPMRDWKAAARNWMLNIPKYAAGKKPTPVAPPKLNPNKNYHEPL